MDSKPNMRLRKYKKILRRGIGDLDSSLIIIMKETILMNEKEKEEMRRKKILDPNHGIQT